MSFFLGFFDSVWFWLFFASALLVNLLFFHLKPECYLHTHIQYTRSRAHTNAIRSGVLNETVWSFISVPRSSMLPPTPSASFSTLHTSIQRACDSISTGQALCVFWWRREGRRDGSTEIALLCDCHRGVRLEREHSLIAHAQQLPPRSLNPPG